MVAVYSNELPLACTPRPTATTVTSMSDYSFASPESPKRFHLYGSGFQGGGTVTCEWHNVGSGGQPSGSEAATVVSDSDVWFDWDYPPEESAYYLGVNVVGNSPAHADAPGSVSCYPGTALHGISPTSSKVGPQDNPTTVHLVLFGIGFASGTNPRMFWTGHGASATKPCTVVNDFEMYVDWEGYTEIPRIGVFAISAEVDGNYPVRSPESFNFEWLAEF